MKKLFAIFALLPLHSAADTFELVRSKEAANIQNVCPDQILIRFDIKEYGTADIVMPPLSSRILSKAQLDRMMANIEDCFGPPLGNGRTDYRLWDNTRVQAPDALEKSSNRNWACRAPGYMSSEEKRREAYRCHQAAGWPSATDYVPPKSNIRPSPPTSANAPNQPNRVGNGDQATTSSKNRSAADQKEALERCGLNADYVGAKGNERRTYMRRCMDETPRAAEAAEAPMETDASMEAESGGKNKNTRAFVYDKHRNNCISVITSPSGGPYQGFRNACDFTVDVAFCIENGVDSKEECSKRQFKTVKLQPGNYEVIDAYSGGMTAKVFAVACREPFYVDPAKIIFKGTKIAADCQREKR
ncbi:hypothetical protein [Acidovorax sp. sic0104]|uniref:hypothetical protein n=1 Tax=Acidovorax sp. sic0104 TaxID=2854784 RepID=UPI001C496945|nr:hypothetical protein [Acidovorax sp. sic0104]MBV7542078.1 hypothetical protein [Acidovorax sp. sic0104]